VAAVHAAADQIERALDGVPATLVMVLASDAHRDRAEAIWSTVVERFPAADLAGAVIAGGVIGRGEETARGPALSLWAAVLPAGSVEVFTLADAADLPAAPGMLILLADPFSIPTDRLIRAADLRGIELVGGFMGGIEPGAARLFATGGVRTSGAVAVRIDVPGIAPLVSQGARPIGGDLVVTAAKHNVAVELAGRPAIEQLHAVLGALAPDDLELARAGLMAGLVIDENRPDYEVGDYLVRGILGVEADTGGLAIAAEPRVGQTFRFQVRDAESADADLRRVVGRAQRPVGSALIFACNGRGRALFAVDHHDAAVLEELLGVPVAGAFCQGEFGPVAGRNHVHAFTSTMIIFPH